jgi:thiosulfate dehydrogenase [quinone] large subunit
MTYPSRNTPHPHHLTWSQVLATPGWLLIPLRAFLGFTFIYAGLQKLANPDFFDTHSPTSIIGQIQSLQHTSPIGGVLGLAAHAPTLAGLAIALGELAVGLGTLLGLYTRVAAAGGALLALVFFLTVSWTTTPYYYGADIVFLFTWVTLVGFGDQGVLSLQTWIAERARRSFSRRPSRVAGVGSPRWQERVDRNTQHSTRRAAVLVAGGAAVLGALTAGMGRLVGGTRRPLPLALSQSSLSRSSVATTAPTSAAVSTTSTAAPHLASRDVTPSSASSTTSTPSTTAPSYAAPRTAPARLRGTAIGPTSGVPVGQARPFTDPATGDPAWLLQPTAGRFVAFDAVCTHAGCTVNYNPAAVRFECPCHGGMFDAHTGRVLQGPPEAPLRPITVTSTGGQLRVDV